MIEEDKDFVADEEIYEDVDNLTHGHSWLPEKLYKVPSPPFKFTDNPEAYTYDPVYLPPLPPLIITPPSAPLPEVPTPAVPVPLPPVPLPPVRRASYFPPPVPPHIAPPSPSCPSRSTPDGCDGISQPPSEAINVDSPLLISSGEAKHFSTPNPGDHTYDSAHDDMLKAYVL